MTYNYGETEIKKKIEQMAVTLAAQSFSPWDSCILKILRD